MQPYIRLLKQVLAEGERREDRTGTGTISIFGTQSRYDLREGFPVVTTKRLAWKNAMKEMLWFLSGSINIRDLGCGVWDAWADEVGSIGLGYPHQLRRWGSELCPWCWNHVVDESEECENCHGIGFTGGVDQIQELIDGIKSSPTSRRHVVSYWNATDLDQMALPPCHTLFQCFVGGIDDDHPGGQYLDLQLYQRSGDLAVGIPFNITGYSLLLSMLAKECDLIHRYFIHSIGDAHIYLNHIDGIREQLKRDTRPLPRLRLPPYNDFFDLVERRHELIDEFRLENYDPHPAIKFNISV